MGFENNYISYCNSKVTMREAYFAMMFGWGYGIVGKYTMQSLFYLTLGGIGVWWVIRFFSLKYDVYNYNRKLARERGLSKWQQCQLGLYRMEKGKYIEYERS